MPRARVLLVEDDPGVQDKLRQAAEVELLELAVESEGRAALATARSFKPDLAILDVGLPGSLDGFDVARRLRDQDDIAVVFLTGATALEDRLAGFQAGADDYVTKPFFIEELNARIHAVLRRRGVSSSAIWNVADLSVDEGTREVRRGDSPIELTRTEFEILLVLVRYRGRVVPRAALAEAVWGYDHSGSAVGVHMSALRRKLEAHGERCIHTMRGVGYILRSPSAEGP